MVSSKHFEDVVQRTIGETVSDAYSDDPIDPVVIWGACLDERDKAEIVVGGIDDFAAVQPVKYARCPSTRALIGHHY